MYKVGLAFLFCILALIFVPAANAQVQTFSSSPGAPISEAAPVQNSITVTNAETIADLNVSVNITHSHGGDLRIRLTHATSGLSIILLRWLNGPGYAYGCGADGINATFDDAAAGPMDSFDCRDNFEMPVSGAWKPTNPLSVFNGQSMAGVWTLEVVDAVQTDNGTLNSWSLIFNTEITAPPPPPPPGFDPELVRDEPPVPLCRDFDGSRAGALVTQMPRQGLGIYCRMLVQDGNYIRNPGEVGITSLIELGIVHAVDVYSPAGTSVTGATICLKGEGDLFFLNAADAPRVPIRQPSTFTNGYTCTVIPNAGTVVLIGSAGAGGGSTQSNEPALATTLLTDCRVTTTTRIRLRTLPEFGARTITVLPEQMTLTATERTAEWFRVVYLNTRGWLNAGFVDVLGSCGE